jgi:hypothetical protein
VIRSLCRPPFSFPAFHLFIFFSLPHPRYPRNPRSNSEVWVPIPNPNPFYRGSRGFHGCEPKQVVRFESLRYRRAIEFLRLFLRPISFEPFGREKAQNAQFLRF